MALKKREFTPESGSVDTYADILITVQPSFRDVFNNLVVFTAGVTISDKTHSLKNRTSSAIFVQLS